MRYEQALYAECPLEITLPLFRPLRLWNPRQVGAPSFEKKEGIRTGTVPARSFSMKGGYMSVNGGERKLMIAGKIFRNLGFES